MKNIFLGATNFDCQEAIIDKLGQNLREGGHHIFLVPDRTTVNVEKRIFEKLNIESTCDVEVLTLSRLASRIIKDVNIISKQASCMILQKLLRENRDKLLCFKKIDADLAENIFGTISQFKSCKINFADVKVKTENKLLQDKLSDISLLYSAYQQKLKQKNLLDSMDRLDLLEEQIANYKQVQESSFYVLNFDGFTYQGYQIISSIAKSCKEFNIGVTFDDGANCHIYNQNYLENVISIAKDANIVKCKKTSDEQFLFLQENLFCFAPNTLKVKQSQIELFEGRNFEQELNFCCSKIKEFVKNGGNLNQINVALPNLENKKQTVQKIFDNFGFDYFLDVQEEFKISVLSKFINNAFNLVVENYSSKSMIAFLKNPLINLDSAMIDDFEDYLLCFSIDDFFDCKNCNVESSTFYQNFVVVREFLINITNRFCEKVEKSTNYNDFVDAYKILLEDCNVGENLENLIKKLSQNNNLKQVKLFEQYLSKLEEIFDSLQTILGEELCDHKTFFVTLTSGINACKLSTPPISTNCVFVGDCSKSFFEKRDLLILLDMSEQEFPNYVIDCGLISDEDIEKLSEKYKLEPSISEINNKERFKAFELLLSAKEKLILSYHYFNKDKSKIFDDIANMFLIDDGVKFNKIKVQNGDNIDFLLQNNNFSLAKNNLIYMIRGVLDGQSDEDEKLDSLYQTLKPQLQNDFFENFNYKNKLILNSNVFFKNNTVSTSQIESFMTCPFLHFVRYGLKLKEKDEGNFDNLNIGNIIHNFVYSLLLTTKLPIDQKQLENKACKIFDNLLQMDKYKALQYNKQNRVLISNLKNEALRLSNVLNEQAKHSRFVPKFLEVRFDDDKQIKTLKIKHKNQIISLVGQVDRIDIFDEFFRIIDYKTGKCNSSLKELFFGKKIQLEAYIKVVEKSLKLKVAGGYYFPIKSGFNKQDKGSMAKYQLKGKTIQNSDVILASDDTLEQNGASDIIEVKLKKSEKIEFSSNSNLASEEELKTYSNYAFMLIKRAIDDILSLDISPSPLLIGSDDPCKSCKYASLCRFDVSFGNCKRNPSKKIEPSDFDKGENDEIHS